MELEEKIKDFQHKFAPMHIYCRLKEMDISKRDAVDLARYYETAFYAPLMRVLKEKIK